MTGGGNLSLKSVGFIAGRDLLNEKLMTACLVMCVLAVLTPLLLILSVKVGFIDRLRKEFIEDPSFREIKPASADLRSAADVIALKTIPSVAFVMPSVMMVPREVDIVYDKGGKIKIESVRLWPSSIEDPLFAKLQGQPPSGDNIVLTNDIADQINAKIGSDIRLQASRVENDVRKKVEIIVKVVGLLDASMLPQPTILASPELDRQFEDYRAGVAVPERSWAGFKSNPAQSFRRLAVVLDDEPGEVLQSNLKIRLGVASLIPANTAAIVEATGFVFSNSVAARKIYLAERPSRPFSAAELREALDVFKNVKVMIYGVNPPLTVEFQGKLVKLIGIDPRLLLWTAPGSPGWSIRSDARLSLNDAVWLPANMLASAAQKAGQTIDLKITFPDEWETKTISLPLKLGGISDGALPSGALESESKQGPVPNGFAYEGNAFASASLLGMLYRGEKLPLAYDPATHSFVERSSGYRGFRLVASDIDSVPGIVAELAERGLAVKARSDEISKLQQLEKSLDTLILVVGLVGSGGGLAILASSFFANVQRKRVDYANMRLMGMRKKQVFQIPIAQAVIVAILGLIASIVAYLLVAWLLNAFVASQLGFDGQLSKLYSHHYLVLTIAVVAGTCVSALSASREATRIDPAQALRAG